MKIGGSIIKIMNDLAKAVETEKMKVSFVCMKWLTVHQSVKFMETLRVE